MNDYDFYDFDKVEKLRNEGACEYMDLVRKWRNAKEKGNNKEKKKIIQAMSKHKEFDKLLKEKAEKAGYYWY